MSRNESKEELQDQVFRTKRVLEKTQTPTWDYQKSHTLELDDEMITKLQNESLVVTVFGLQDGPEKFGKLQNAFNK